MVLFGIPRRVNFRRVGIRPAGRDLSRRKGVDRFLKRPPNAPSPSRTPIEEQESADEQGDSQVERNGGTFAEQFGKYGG